MSEKPNKLFPYNVILLNYFLGHVNPSPFSTLDNNTNDVSSSSDSSSTTSEDNIITTGESNYSPSESDAESSTSCELQVPLTSLVSSGLDPDEEDATAINNDKKSRKRKADKSTWKKNMAKKLKDQGKAYVSSTTNKTMKERTMGPPCRSTCRLKCYSNIPNQTREQIFQEYWGLGDANKQRDFISYCIVAIKPKYQYHVHENKRRDNNGFYFTLNEARIRVCKTFFKSTLSITDRPIRTVVEKRSDIGIVENDRRGKHKNHRKLHESIREEMKCHINSIPRIESHYTRSRSSREYIEGGKSLADLYRDYVEDCKQKKIPYGKYLIYHQVFHKDFNISFFTPKKDQCSLCVSYDNASETQKQELSTEYENHIMEKDLSRLEKNNDKKRISNNYVVAVFDLQAVLPCPKGNVSLFYYKSKLNVLNFTIYEMKGNANLDECFCYVWDETNGNRGANEIGSCLLRYIEHTSKNRSECDNLELVFFSDNCAGQQKNKYIISLYMYALKKYPNIRSICHKFLVTGHTQNEGDCAHSVIERQVKRYLKSSPIYLPNEYTTLIRTAKKSGKPFQVMELSFKDFFDLKDLNGRIGNFVGGEKLSDVRVLKIEKNYPFTVFYKTSYSQADFSEMTVKTVRSKSNVLSLTLEPAYKSKIKISERKRSDLQDLLKDAGIPSCYADFYNNL